MPGLASLLGVTFGHGHECLGYYVVLGASIRDRVRRGWQGCSLRVCQLEGPLDAPFRHSALRCPPPLASGSSGTAGWPGSALLPWRRANARGFSQGTGKPSGGDGCFCWRYRTGPGRRSFALSGWNYMFFASFGHARHFVPRFVPRGTKRPRQRAQVRSTPRLRVCIAIHPRCRHRVVMCFRKRSRRCV